MPFIENNKVYNVVFLIESSANLGSYFDLLKKTYLLPIVEFFNGGPFNELDFADEEVSSRYLIVNFHGTERLLWGLVTRKGPVRKASEIYKKFNHIDFYSGMYDSLSVVNDGLAVTLDLLDDYEKQWEYHPGIVPERHVILVCNTAPFQALSTRGKNYKGKNAEELVQIMTEKNIRLSVVCPKKIAQIHRLFELNNPDASAFTKNYADDSRHMILLNGIHIQERPLSPSLREDACNSAVPRTQQGQLIVVRILRNTLKK